MYAVPTTLFVAVQSCVFESCKQFLVKTKVSALDCFSF